MKKNDTYELSPNAWYFKLLKYTLNLSYTDFNYVCPLFWVTVVAVILSPILLPISFVGHLIGRVTDNIRTEKNEVFNAWAETYYRDITSNETTFESLKKTNFWDKRANPQMHRFVFSYLREHDWKKYAELSKIAELEWSKLAFVKKERITKITNIARPIGKGFLYLIAGIGIIILGHLLVLLFNYLCTLPAADWIVVMWYAVGIIGGFFLMLVLSWLSDLFWSGLKAILKKWFKPVGRVLAWPFIKIGQGFKFLGTIISDYCPAIRYK